MPEFFQTIMGRKFYEADVPRALKALERIAGALERLAQERERTQDRAVEREANAAFACDCGKPDCPDKDGKERAQMLCESHGDDEVCALCEGAGVPAKGEIAKIR